MECQKTKHIKDLDSLKLAISITTSVNHPCILKEQIHGHVSSFLHI